VKEKWKMKMKQLSVIFVALLISVGTLVPAAQAAISVTGDAYVGYYNMYLWRGENLSESRPVVQGGVDLSTHGFTLSYWSNLQTHDGEMTETDVTLDYTYDINKLLSVSAGNIFYALDGIPDTNELYFGASVNTLLSPAVKIYWDYDEADEDGYFITASVGHTFDLMDKLGLNLGALISYNGASDYSVGDYHNWHNYELSASLDYAVTDQVTVSPSFVFSAPISGDARVDYKNQNLVGVNASFSF
jgi:uncharacterized protein (TIGR02001 family)